MFTVGLLLTFTAVVIAQNTTFRLTDFASGFTRPVDIAHAGDSRLFIVEQRGQIWVLDSTGRRVGTTPFLNIMTPVRDNANEQGLLGLAFHPNYAQNGYFYVNYTREPDGATRISRFTVPRNATQADPGTEQILLEVPQPFNNHNGGCLKFGPDGFLYIALGDGGSGGDPRNSGQDRQSLLGKFLRIDVNNATAGRNYAIPADNPFVNNTAYRPEIWSLGWRNPWRFSFDRQTGDIWVGDVGQNTREEISYEPARRGGLNYGWRCYEGFRAYNTNNCQDESNYARPVFDYATGTSTGCSVTGGFVYRGRRFPNLTGQYIFADFCSGRWWATRRTGTNTFETRELVDLNGDYSTLGEDVRGELYTASLGGQIFRIEGSTLNSSEPVSPVVHFSVTPNPATDQALLSLTLSAPDDIQASLTDLQGRTVWQQQYRSEALNTPIDLRALPVGWYVLGLRLSSGVTLTEKVIKK
jgi:glucose/arabinose dehydrogenase